VSKTVLLFPGQGSQRVGMGRELALAHPEASAVYAEADEALGLPLSRLCWDGPEDELQLTANTQPAILATSIAVHRVLLARGLRFDVVAGHSLGEWSALVAAGALTLRDALRLVRLRGQAMQDAVPVGVGAMAALMGLEADAVDALCAASSAPDEPVSAANFNGAGQVVISGAKAAVERAVAAAKGAGAKRAVMLAVSAPFHCALMAPARARLEAALAEVAIAAPSVPLVTNVRAEPTQDAALIRELLGEQVTAPVRWEASVQRLATMEVTRGLELGAGSVLRGLVKRIAPSIEVATIGEPHEVAAFTA
jgi:[acyl-carrier-protein] S-malonyltransferase